jgi:signal transduction histidine kinase
MKLLNRSLIYLSIAFLLIIGIWAVIFYFNLKDEIRDSIDDGLDNSRLLILQKITTEPYLLLQDRFGGNNFEIHPLSKEKAIGFRDVYKDTVMYRLNEEDLEPVRILHTAFSHDDRYYRLKIISSLVEEDDLIEDSFWSVVWLFFILMFSVIIVNNVILRKVWNPFYEILNRLKTYRLDRDDHPLDIPTRTKEFRELQKASHVLIAHSRESYNSQKQFTENASHELQTPLAVITNKLELLLESDDLKEGDAQRIADILRNVGQLAKFNKSLLLLAKIENRQFVAPEQISINGLAKQILVDFQDFTEFRNIQVAMEETGNLSVEMDSVLAGLLLSNLFKNAIVHNVDPGNIDLRITDEELIICNSGNHTGLPPEKIFGRFHKGTDKNKGTGLGLAICKSICDFYGISLTYRFVENQHCFTVNFKKIVSKG